VAVGCVIRRGQAKVAKVPAMRALCDYCAEVFGAVYGVGCQRDDGNARRQCLLTLQQDLQELRARLDA